MSLLKKLLQRKIKFFKEQRSRSKNPMKLLFFRNKDEGIRSWEGLRKVRKRGEG